MLQAEKRFNVVLDLCAHNRDDMAAMRSSRYKLWSGTLLIDQHPKHAFNSCLKHAVLLQAEKRFSMVLDLCARNRDEMAAVTTADTRCNADLCLLFNINCMHQNHAV